MEMAAQEGARGGVENVPGILALGAGVEVVVTAGRADAGSQQACRVWHPGLQQLLTSGRHQLDPRRRPRS